MHSLLLHEIGHMLVYFVMLIPLLVVLGEKKLLTKYALVGFLVTMLLDADHLYEYMLSVDWSTFNLADFLSSSYFDKIGRIYVLFHAWEWVALTLIIYKLTASKHKWLLYVAVGVAAQLVFDTLSYGFDPRVYFISYRYVNDFALSIFRPVLY